MCIRCLKEGDDPVIPSLFDPNKLRKTKRKKQIEQIICPPIDKSSAEGNTTDADIHTASEKVSPSAVTTEHLPELNSSLPLLVVNYLESVIPLKSSSVESDTVDRPMKVPEDISSPPTTSVIFFSTSGNNSKDDMDMAIKISPVEDLELKNYSFHGRLESNSNHTTDTGSNLNNSDEVINSYRPYLMATVAVVSIFLLFNKFNKRID